MAGRADGAMTKPRRRRAPKAPRAAGATSGRAPRPSKRPPPPRGPSERTIALRVAAAVVVVAVVGYVALVFGYGSMQGPGTGREVELDWPAESSPEAAAARLAAAGVVDSPSLFAWYLRATGGTSSFRPGPHLLTDDASPRALVRRLSRAHTGEHAKLKIPEGYNRFDVAKRVQQTRIAGARAFLAATTDKALLAELGVPGDSAEGFLFPATYDLPLDSEPREVVRRLVLEFDKRFDKLERAHAAGVSALSAVRFGKREIVTLASIVEKEAAVDDERPLIASVFLNRLRDPSFLPHQRLQSDATTAYGCIAAPERAPSCRAYAGRVTPEMNADDGNPYSTYRHDGLTPGPIANPGERSLEAVLAPADTRFFYFVARGEGRHTFSETLTQHNDAIRKGKGGGG